MAEQSETKLEIMALWRHESANGRTYYTGHLNGLRVVAFENTDKRNEKEPDLRIYVQAKKADSAARDEQDEYQDVDSIPF